jgi:serine/threonine protein kinase
MPEAVIHPSPQELSAFSLGRLSDEATAAIASHLEECTACRRAVENSGPDSFVSKVRAAKPGGSSLPPGASPPLTGGASRGAKNEAAPPPENLPPELANHPRYRILRELGRGGMGVVYQAVQTLMDRTVAVKVISPSVLEHRDALARFQAEVKAAAKLDHANIVRAYDADQVGGLHLLVMEFVQGMSLADLVSHKGPLPIAHACHFIRQAALGLQHAFEQGMVHRDIKPQNLMVTAKGQVKILDFGLARLRSESAKGGGLTDAGSFMGTPEYVSPEQATDARTADTRADLYSLGCTLYFLLTGQPPFEEDTAVKLVLAQIEKEPRPLHELRADVPAELSAVAACLLAKNPAQRFQTPIELAQALVPFIKTAAKGSPPSRAASPPPVPSPAAGTQIGWDTSKMPQPRKEQAGRAAAPERPPPLEAEPFKNLAVTTALPKKMPWYRRWRVLTAGGVVILLMTICLGIGWHRYGEWKARQDVERADQERQQKEAAERQREREEQHARAEEKQRREERARQERIEREEAAAKEAEARRAALEAERKKREVEEVQAEKARLEATAKLQAQQEAERQARQAKEEAERQTSEKTRRIQKAIVAYAEAKLPSWRRIRDQEWDGPREATNQKGEKGSVYQVKGRVRILDANRSTWKSVTTFHYFFVVGETVIDMQDLNGSWEALKTWKLAER